MGQSSGKRCWIFLTLLLEILVHVCLLMSMLASVSLFFYEGLYVKARRVVLRGREIINKAPLKKTACVQKNIKTASNNYSSIILI